MKTESNLQLKRVGTVEQREASAVTWKALPRFFNLNTVDLDCKHDDEGILMIQRLIHDSVYNGMRHPATNQVCGRPICSN